MFSSKKYFEKILHNAGITINGQHEYDIQVLNESLYNRVLIGGSLALGESYMEGWWDVKNLDEFFHRILSSQLDKKFNFSIPKIQSFLHSLFFNLQDTSRAFEVGQKHYDIGNDVYQAMLDERLVYSCGYWHPSTSLRAGAKNLNQAQEAKLDLICKKLGLKKGDTVLDIGCGWGSFLKFAAQKYHIKGTGITVSKNQLELARKLCQKLPVNFMLQDYRTLKGKFDHVVSIGMFEHVGVKNYKEYMEKVHGLLKDDGLFLLHTIGSNVSLISGDPWLEKYIFPNGMLPSVAQISKSMEGLFVMEDWHNFGTDYDKTLMAWFKNFDKAWPRLRQGFCGQATTIRKYDERFYRMWKYYLLCCAGIFRARKAQLWQVVLSKKGVSEGYTSIR